VNELIRFRIRRESGEIGGLQLPGQGVAMSKKRIGNGLRVW
jgi:hypothetical protein